MFKQIFLTLALTILSTMAMAVPTLQVGVPDGSGGYVGYLPILVDPAEEGTAVTSGNMLSVAAVFGPNVVAIGSSPVSSWSAFSNPNFGNAGAVLMATVPGDLGIGTLTVGGMVPIYTTGLFEDGFAMPNPPSNHAPVENKNENLSYLFFDIGNFSNVGTVPNFADASHTASGQVKTLTFDVAGFDWVHFDLFALVTTSGDQVSFAGNPGSHDVTWKEDGGGPPTGVPEPGTLLLLGCALSVLGLRRRIRR